MGACEREAGYRLRKAGAGRTATTAWIALLTAGLPSAAMLGLLFGNHAAAGLAISSTGILGLNVAAGRLMLASHSDQDEAGTMRAAILGSAALAIVGGAIVVAM